MAIEEGLPLVRAANTGISAVVDPLGRIIQKLPLGTVKNKLFRARNLLKVELEGFVEPL